MCGCKKICWIGRLDLVKGYKRFLDVAKALYWFHPDWEFSMVCGGKHPDLREELSKKYPFITFYGYRNDVPTFLKTQDVMILTSEAEGSPAALLEARACGCEVISLSDVGAVKEMLAVHINNYSYETVGEKWEKLLEKPSL